MSSPKKSTRSFFLGIVITLACLLCSWLLLVNSLAGHPHVHNQWVEQAYIHKLAAAERLNEPRMLIVAGSGALFGIDSAALGKALGRPATNLGVNAGILAPYILSYAEQALRPGDWIVLPLEYPLYHDEHMVNQQFIDFYASHPLPISDIGFLRWVKTLWLLPVARIAEGHRGLPQGFAVSGLYGPQNLNEYGDQLNSQTSRRTEAMRAAIAGHPPERYGKRANSTNASWSRWQKFAETVKSQGGCAIFVPPAMLASPSYQEDPTERHYYESLPAQALSNGLLFAGSPSAFMYQEMAFFDTNFHLTSEQRAAHTSKLVDLLKPFMAQHCKD